MKRIIDPEGQWLAKIVTTIKRDYTREDSSWVDSPFAWIRTRPSRQVGKIGEQMVAGWCTAKGFSAAKCRHPEADLIVAGRRAEVKFSTLWESCAYVAAKPPEWLAGHGGTLEQALEILRGMCLWPASDWRTACLVSPLAT